MPGTELDQWRGRRPQLARLSSTTDSKAAAQRSAARGPFTGVTHPRLSRQWAVASGLGEQNPIPQRDTHRTRGHRRTKPGVDSSGSAEGRPPGASGVVTPSSVSPLGGASAPPLGDRGLRRELLCETEPCEPVLHVEVEPVARDNPVLDRHGVSRTRGTADACPSREWSRRLAPSVSRCWSQRSMPRRSGAGIWRQSSGSIRAAVAGSPGKPRPAGPVHRGGPVRPAAPEPAQVDRSLQRGRLFRYALNEKADRPTLLKLYQQTPVRYWSKEV